ncbi:MAG: dihydrodipicolinate synthase family protein [Maribacter sp.]
MHIIQNTSGKRNAVFLYLSVRESSFTNKPLRGIIPPMVTPLLENGNLDVIGLTTLVNYLLEAGVHGLFLLGTTGEGPSLNAELKKQLVTQVCRIVKKKVPVLVCITDTSLEDSVRLADHAKSAGADFLVVAPPYYFPISQKEMQEYLVQLAPKMTLPFLMYNMPSCTKMHLSIRTLKKAKELGAIGIKDSSGNQNYLFSLIETFKNDPLFSVITGNEAFLPELIKRGGHGTVAGGANFFPKLFVALYDACIENDTEAITEHLAWVNWVSDTIYDVGKQESKYIKGTKSSLSLMGICQDYAKSPIGRFTEKERAKVAAYLAHFPYEKVYFRL